MFSVEIIKRLSKRVIIRLFDYIYFIVCGTPPTMLNGNHSGPNNPSVGKVIRYSCNEGFFSYGINSDVFETVCLGDRTYTKYAKDLASCYAISKKYCLVAKAFDTSVFISS